jgi:hypothetical protein
MLDMIDGYWHAKKVECSENHTMIQPYSVSHYPGYSLFNCSNIAVGHVACDIAKCPGTG